MQQNLLNDLKDALEKDQNLVIDGQLNKTLIEQKALSLDKEFLRLILDTDSLKKHFFEDIDGTLVFDKVKFQQFIHNKSFLPDSYTTFKNKIGLTTNGEYLSKSGEVVLAWPHKDCVLEGGQDKEDARRDEIFWNETLAPDDIDRLLSPKVFTNWKKYDNDGEQEVEEPSLNDNYLIKGNNLLALHSLADVYRGKVKLIYIDPPYNTSGEANTFSYNNSFNHSSWLSFMKSRIEVGKELLKKDGLFIISIDHFELFYLGVLADEIFGRENRLGVISVVHNPGGRQDDKFFPTAHENMLVYSKDYNYASINTLGKTKDKIAQFIYEDEYGMYKTRGFRRSGSNSSREARPGLFYPIYYNSDSGELSVEKKEEWIEILPIDSNGEEKCWRWGKETFLGKKDKYIEVKKNGDSYDIYTKERESDYEGEKPKTIWHKSKYTGQTATHGLKSLFGKKLFSYPKSPYLMQDVLLMSTEKDDLVLDFFSGSGTTAAVAHKMGRRYIGIEQMDYVEEVTKKRLQKVIEGEQGGISKEVEWKGGGSFIYAELKQANQKWVEEIQDAKDEKVLKTIWEKMKEKAFISYKVNPGDIDENAEEFGQLSLEDQKQFLIEVLDKNLLYVNYSEIDDADFEVSDGDKKLNHAFYGLKK